MTDALDAARDLYLAAEEAIDKTNWNAAMAHATVGILRLLLDEATPDNPPPGPPDPPPVGYSTKYIDEYVSDKPAREHSIAITEGQGG